MYEHESRRESRSEPVGSSALAFAENLHMTSSAIALSGTHKNLQLHRLGFRHADVISVPGYELNLKDNTVTRYLMAAIAVDLTIYNAHYPISSVLITLYNVYMCLSSLSSVNSAIQNS